MMKKSKVNSQSKKATESKRLFKYHFAAYHQKTRLSHS